MPVAVGADLSVESLTAAYRSGYYPVPPTNDYWRNWNEEKYGAALDSGAIPALGDRYPGFTLPWWSPARRAVLLPETARLGRTVRQSLKQNGWTTTMDTATEAVIERCGPARGEPTWLSREVADAYLRLWETGIVHSVEVWDENGELIGGTFGVLTGTVLTGESCFRSRDNAVRVALLDGLLRLVDAGGDLFDFQILSGYLPSVGAVEIPKQEFHERLDAGRKCDLVLPTERRSLERILRFRPKPGHVPEP
jgi:leucyl/phenylalanyl-tRNA--protein transferase